MKKFKNFLLAGALALSAVVGAVAAMDNKKVQKTNAADKVTNTITCKDFYDQADEDNIPSYTCTAQGLEGDLTSF